MYGLYGKINLKILNDNGKINWRIVFENYFKRNIWNVFFRYVLKNIIKKIIPLSIYFCVLNLR